jgi:hypothetical protein
MFNVVIFNFNAVLLSVIRLFDLAIVQVKLNLPECRRWEIFKVEHLMVPDAHHFTGTRCREYV